MGSKPNPIKSLNMSSAIGRSPVAAAPTAVLNVMCSAIGVSITRLRLYFFASPFVTPNTPPNVSSSLMWSTFAPPETSVPIKMTSSSFSIDWSMASLIAPINVNLRSSLIVKTSLCG